MGANSSSPEEIPTPTFPVPGGDIGVMSVYQPFPLRIGGQQHDACFQIGEFSMPDATGVGTGIVILIPLKVSSNVGKGGKFINAFASSIPNILGGTPDILTGFPDVQVTGLTSWNVADILQSDRPFYTWTAKDGTRVIVMAEPVLISDGDMTNIKRLPITTPGDAIHDIADNIFYKSAPPIDCAGNPVLCRKPFTIVQPPVAVKKIEDRKEWGLTVMSGVGYLFLMLIGVWFALWLTTGPGERMMKSIGTTLGNMFTSRRVKPAPPEPAKPAPPPKEPASPRPPPSPTEPAPSPKAPTPVAKPPPLAPIRIPPTTETGGGKPA